MRKVERCVQDLTQSDDHDGDVESLSGVLRQTQKTIFQRILHDVLLLRPH